MKTKEEKKKSFPESVFFHFSKPEIEMTNLISNRFFCKKRQGKVVDGRNKPLLFWNQQDLPMELEPYAVSVQTASLWLILQMK